MAARGETSLPKLLQSMNPTLQPDTYVFGHIPAASDDDFQNVLRVLVSVPTQMLFRENEGWTAVVQEEVAQGIGLDHVFPCKKITLNVHSSLEAVAFMAAVATRLASEVACGINPVSGYHHDHLFVPVGKEHAVMEALKKLSSEQST